WSWGVSLLVLAAIMLGSFLVWERIAADPILPLDLIFSAHIAAAIAGSFLIGGILFGIDTYIPLFIQGVRGGSATQAGKMITPLFLSWSISVTVAAQIVGRMGFRRMGVAGAILITTGMAAAALGTVWPDWSTVLLVLGMIVIGMGMGSTSLSQILS